MRLGLPDRFLYQVTGTTRPFPNPEANADFFLKNKPYLVNLLLFAVTFIFTLIIGTQFHISYHNIVLPHESGLFTLILKNPAMLLWGMPYSLSLMLILLIHELGHFFACRSHRIEATLPFFIPAPTLIGTFGAFIKIKTPFSSKKSLFDVGIAGPLAGFLAAIPVICIGIAQSRLIEKSSVPTAITLGEPIIFTLIARILKGPIDARFDLLIHPIAFAGWFGLLATSFNLFPIGQLDGGHIVYSLFGKKSYYAGIAAVVVLMVLGVLFWQGWLFWALIAVLIGLRHPPIFEEERLDLKRKTIAFAGLVIFVLSFTPAPLSLVR